ncbi:MAG TPA: multifunctional CCA addition/repair protein [Steroidobacteraceae bacterium]|nr:multifunctional CCA addition/repair protein [Steroidobacteraceae bacterium]
MRVYLVGGAVRDRLLQRPVKERDWVVVGATPEELVRLGYEPVGREFPVFLHPTTHEEHALARLERKVGPGYRGFTTQFAPTVTLEEDLKRRDLTINAMAQDENGALIDPYGGQADLAARLLRHVSEAFVEDPVRVLRVARFAARYAQLGFQIAPATRALMRQITASGEIAALTPERVWRETARALLEPHPEVFFTTLRECGALAVLMPELDALAGVPQPVKWHPEVDTFVHVMLALAIAAQRQAPLAVRYAVLLHDLGKALTPPAQWPAHHQHEQTGVAPIEQLSSRLRAPNDCRELAVLTSRHHTLVHRALELRAVTLLKLLNETDALRRPDRFGDLLLACECDARGREGLSERAYPQAEYLREVLKAAAGAVLTPESRAGLTGPQIGAALQQQRLAAVTQVRERALTANRADPGA